MSLKEDCVVDIVAKWLEKKGYTVESRKGTRSGHDIEAKKDGSRPVYIECKGSKSPRTGKEFSKHYKWQCVGGAVINQLRLISKEPKANIGIALPAEDKDQYYRKVLLEGLRKALKSQKILLYWASDDGSVEVELGNE